MPYILVDNTQDWEPLGLDWGGLERISFDPANPKAAPAITCLLERDGGHLARYKVRLKWKEPELSIEYLRGDNQHLFDERPKLAETDIIWGVHVLTIENGAEYGPSVWQANGEPECVGPGWRLEAISGGRTNRKRGTIWAIQRDQQSQFRQWLLANDEHCALTGETCESVLEAAHIVPAHQGGQEVPANGILLRADIHRLFDADAPMFKIRANNGQVVPKKGFNYDSANLDGVQIPQDVRERIAGALEMRHALLRAIQGRWSRNRPRT